MCLCLLEEKEEGRNQRSAAWPSKKIPHPIPRVTTPAAKKKIKQKTKPTHPTLDIKHLHTIIHQHAPLPTYFVPRSRREPAREARGPDVCGPGEGGEEALQRPRVGGPVSGWGGSGGRSGLGTYRWRGRRIWRSRSRGEAGSRSVSREQQQQLHGVEREEAEEGGAPEPGGGRGSGGLNVTS